jgi:hypothetical protein
LILVNEDVAEFVVVGIAHLFVFAQEADGFDEEVVEVERVVVDEAFFVEAIDAGDGGAFFVAVFDARGVGFGVRAAVLGVADGGLHLTRAHALGVES